MRSRIRHSGKKPDDHILSFGRLKALFGEPLHLSEGPGDQYTRFLSAVAAALAARINSASPTGYDYKVCCFDSPCHVRTGARKGVPCREENKLNNEEFEQILRKIGNR